MPRWPWQQKPSAQAKTTYPVKIGGHPTDDIEERAGMAFNAKDWPLAERLYREVIAKGDPEGVMVARNMLGTVLEKTGRADEAIKIYGENARAGADTPHTYLRLAIIYRRQGQIQDEIRILERGIAVLRQAHGASAGGDLKERLAKLQAKE